MRKQAIKLVLKGSIASGLMATLPALAQPAWASEALSLEAGLAPLLALGFSALFYLRSGSDV